MIYTCTLNPSIDYIMHVNEFEAGGLNRAQDTSYYPGGKGINVSRVMSRLDVQTQAIGYIGGFTGAFVQQFLDSESIQHDFIDTKQHTRINVKLKSNEETEINGPGSEISEQLQQELLRKIKRLSNKDTLVLAGSLPSSLPADFYVQMSTICAENDTKVVADTSGSALEQLLGHPLFLLKPNHHELGDLFNVTIDSRKKAAFYGRKLIDQGVKHVIVSMGGEGAVYIGHRKELYANVPKGEVKNSVGAGDSVVSGFLAALEKDEPIEDAFRYGVASGSATAFQDDLCKKEDVEHLLSQIDVSAINEKE
ncbi:fructose-1-phosphate kinase [Halobacillus karajensis]|uniref:Tagatose-6-phosphate kinase n=1 Tax=Halobacillus karajensis TaxID=195088 RepID=A0A059NWD4_9BACI|nr:1-phosphofructokinase [Halobacillus karajensis]CDQ19283.1 Tagatose-6-phosphate kinase [Halobacillus karajensis]CDQ22643.1 Tagatose-6-phosphate kinase [Halobacillus karajensis]CDQ26125.1 Tagatose-6-phosphate kinase [Halobacillus karajensis]SEH38884.1 fructose-1-phosphate kinase [Halobacillus karajensis]